MEQNNKKSTIKDIFLKLNETLDKLANSILNLAKTNKTISIIIGILVIIYMFFKLWLIFYDVKEKIPKEKAKIEFISKDKNTLKVLILPFKNYDNSNLKVAESVTDRLKEKIENENVNLEVIYDSLSVPTTLYSEAENIAKKKEIIPDLVIFGEYEHNNYKIKLLNLTKDTLNTMFFQDYLPKKISSKYIKNSSSEKIKYSNEINDQEYVIYKILFYTAIKNRNCNEANKIINSIVNIINKSNNAEIIKYELNDFAISLSMCYYINNKIDDALRIINWNLKNFPYSYETRINKVSLLMNKLFLTNKKDSLLKEMHNELNTLKTMNTDLESVPYLFSSFLYFLDNNFKKGISELEIAKKIETKDSIFPISSFIINLFKGNFDKNKKLYDSIKYKYDINSDISSNLFYFFHNILDGNINGAIKNMSFISKYKYPTHFFEDESFNFFLSIRKNIVDNLNINIDSTYNSLHNTYSNKAEKEFENALMLAYLLRNKEDLKYIIKHLKKIVEINPDYGNYFNFNNLPKDSVVILKNNIFKYKDTISANPNNYIALSILANDYYKLGYDFISYYYSIKAIDINLNSLLYLKNTELAKPERDSLIKTYIHYSKFLHTNTDKKTKAQAYQKIAMVLKKYGSIEFSREYYEKAISIDPSYPNSYSGLGWLEIEENNYEKALNLFKKQYQIKPESFSALYNLAAVYYYLKNWKLEKQYLEMSINRYDPSIKYTSLKQLYEHLDFAEKKLKTTPNIMYK